MRTTMNKNIPLLGLFLLSISAFSPLHAENTFAQELRAECNKIKSEAQLGKQAYDQKKSLYTTNFTEPLSYQDSAFLKLPKFP